MSSLSAKCLIEIPGISTMQTRTEMFAVLKENVGSCKLTFSDYLMSNVEVSENANTVIFGVLQPGQIMRLAVGMQERCYRRAFSLFEKGAESVTNENRPQLPIVARTIFDFEQALLRGADKDRVGYSQMVKALENVMNRPNSESYEMFIGNYEHMGVFGKKIGSYPEKDDIQYINAHPEDFAYVEICFTKLQVI